MSVPPLYGLGGAAVEAQPIGRCEAHLNRIAHQCMDELVRVRRLERLDEPCLRGFGDEVETRRR